MDTSVSLGCYKKVDGVNITAAHAINSYGILQNNDLDSRFKLRMLKNVQFTEEEDPIFYNYLYDSDINPPQKINVISDVINSLIKPCSV